MRTHDLTKREPAIKEINKILDKHCIADLSVAEIQRLMTVSYTKKTITDLMLSMDIDFAAEKAAFIDAAMDKAIEEIAPIDLGYTAICDKLGFKYQSQSVANRLKARNIDIFKIRDDFIKTQLIEILNESDETPRYKYHQLLDDRNAHQSHDTIRLHLNEIRDTPELRARLKNPNHPNLEKRVNCKTTKTNN